MIGKFILLSAVAVAYGLPQNVAANGLQENGAAAYLPNGCPDDGIRHLLPHETNCELFYICFNGVKILMSCAHETAFDFEAQLCTDARFAKCGTLIPNRCPDDFSAHQLLPHETECDLFYTCVHGSKVLMPCAPGTAFDFEAQQCTFPFLAKCVSGSLKVIENGLKLNKEVAYLPNGCADDDSAHQRLPHETECDLFYTCVHGNKVLVSCAPGTAFDFEAQVCDWKKNVSCGNRG